MKKKIFIGIGAVLTVALLAGAAFMAVRLLNTKAADGGAGPLLTGIGGPGGGAGSFAMRIEMTPAAEVPTAQADLTGQVANVKDNSIFVSDMAKGGAEGGSTVIVGKAITSSGGSTTDGGGPSTNSDQAPTPSGPLTEVVISKETLIYRDTSMDSIPKPSGSGSTTTVIQQKVVLVDIAQITSNSMVQVWGQKRGDRLIADTILVMGMGVIEIKAGDAPAGGN